MFIIITFLASGLLGTIVALRLMAIEENHTLTRRGRLVVGISAGICVAIIVVFMNGLWWNCNSVSCGYDWGY